MHAISSFSIDMSERYILSFLLQIIVSPENPVKSICSLSGETFSWVFFHLKTNEKVSKAEDSNLYLGEC